MLAGSTAVVILGASVAPFLAPPVVRFEQDRVGVGALTGYAPEQLDHFTGSLLSDLVLWTGDFGVWDFSAPRCCVAPVLDAAERSHMRDVRNVFTGFWLVVLAGVVALAIGFRRARSPEARSHAWRAIRNGARGLAVAIAVAGVFAVVAFDAAFELFHRLFFSAGTYTFDPRTDKLVQLFPEQFWSEIAIAVGVVGLAVSLATAWRAGAMAGATA